MRLSFALYCVRCYWWFVQKIMGSQEELQFAEITCEDEMSSYIQAMNCSELKKKITLYVCLLSRDFVEILNLLHTTYFRRIYFAFTMFINLATEAEILNTTRAIYVHMHIF